MPSFRVHGYLQEGFDVIAHRGASLERPENTMESFARALEIYPQAVLELDVHRTRDGQIVVSHDPSTERTTERNHWILATDYAELRKLDAGFWFTPDQGRSYPFRGKGVRIPRLEEVLHAFPKTRLSIDIKDKIPGNTYDVLDVVERAGAVNRVVISSEYSENLREARAVDSRFCTGYGFQEILHAVASDEIMKGRFFPLSGDVLQIPIEQRTGPAGALRVRVLTPTLLQRAHDLGRKVHVWTINDEAEMRMLMEMGVDGIVTDAAGLLVKVARELNKIL